MKNTYIILFIAFVVIVGGYFVYKNQDFTNEIKEMETENERPTGGFFSDILNFGFDYPSGPDGYVLENSETNDTNPNFVRSFLLMRSDDKNNIDKIPVGGEWPPMITILVLKNPENKTPAIWAEANKNYSNINLKTGDVVDFTIDGNSAIRYTADGLYMSDNVVVASGENIFVISGAYMDQESAIYKDFSTILSTVTFKGEIQTEQ